MLPEALEAGLIAIESGCNSGVVLKDIVPHLTEALEAARAIRASRTIRDKYTNFNRAQTYQIYRAQILSGLVSHFPEVLPEALESARAIRNENDRAQTLSALAPHFPEVLPEALEAASAIGDEYNRVQALKRLVPYLTESLLPEVLKAARFVRNEEHRARLLQDLAPHLPESLLTEALEATSAMFNDYYRNEVYRNLIERLTSFSVDFSLWQKTLHILANEPRYSFLTHIAQLAPLIKKLGKFEALKETAKAVKDVSQWWK